MKPLQIYHVSSQNRVRIEDSSNYYTSEFKDIQEAKEMMVVHVPDLLIYQISETREVKAIFHFLKALNKEVPTIISSEIIEKADTLDFIHSGAIAYIDLNDFDAEKQLKESINETVSFLVKKEEMV